jgi:phosphatidylglycerol:prolipoprotein diacylglycerol transferase
VYSTSDFFALPLLLSLSAGRIGNFMNQELVGIPTQSGIGIVFPDYDNLERYPYQLFASFKNLVVFQIMLYLYMFKRLKTGVMTLLTIFLYSLGRFFLDFIREPTTIIFSFPLGQWISILFMAVTLYLLYKIYNSGERGITTKHRHGEKNNNSGKNSRADKKNKR